jgi:hypothetical protein
MKQEQPSTYVVFARDREFKIKANGWKMDGYLHFTLNEEVIATFTQWDNWIKQ